MRSIAFVLFCWMPLLAFCRVEVGVDVFFQDGYGEKIKDKKIALITNHTAINRECKSAVDLFLEKNFNVVAIFAPEHGFEGYELAEKEVKDSLFEKKIPIYSLYGKLRRPSADILKNIDVIIYDIQEIGSRSYTFATTLFYVMEEAAKQKISVFVLDRPNPLGGKIVDGPLLAETMRSFLGYVNVPYCHGFTIGEFARYFNEEYEIGCDLCVVPMKGWKRDMPFSKTGLVWIPTSPHIPEADTPFYYPSTGILGELELVNIGIGYTLPFKIVGAPWIEKKRFCKLLNKQKLPGVRFIPFSFRPFYGPYKGKDCHGIKIIITDETIYRPLSVQYALLGLLKSLYPEKVKKKLESLSSSRKRIFSLVNGSEEIWNFLMDEKYPTWKMIQFQKKELQIFLEKRKKYLLY